MVEWNCPHCSELLKMDDRYAGRRARCYACDAAQIIPEPAADGTAEGMVGLIDAPPEPDDLRADPPPFVTGAAPPPKKRRPRPGEQNPT